MICHSNPLLPSGPLPGSWHKYSYALHVSCPKLWHYPSTPSHVSRSLNSNPSNPFFRILARIKKLALKFSSCFRTVTATSPGQNFFPASDRIVSYLVMSSMLSLFQPWRFGLSFVFGDVEEKSLVWVFWYRSMLVLVFLQSPVAFLGTNIKNTT